ncbi:MAG: deoxyribodipyrimidine photolyase [Rhizobiales bacterium 32-66-8]|nr:MAG: deoxyribodipyrimidine photolyase [Rhizobiales bacterium 32-66-8]
MSQSEVSAAPALVWFRNDLRLADNPALHQACAQDRPVVAVYLLDEQSPGIRALGGAARWWLAQSLRALSADLARHSVALVLRRGPAAQVIPDLVGAIGAGELLFNGRPGAAEKRVDAAVVEQVRAAGCTARAFNANLLHMPGSVVTAGGTLPRTFSAFHRAALRERRLRAPYPAPSTIRSFPQTPPSEGLETTLTAWGLEPTAPDWAGGLRAAWACGEAAAQRKLADFLDSGLRVYAGQRDFPSVPGVSRLSPHLRFGELSPLQVLHAARHACEAGKVPARDADKFEAELYWREFSHHVLEAEPDIGHRNLQRAFDAFPWRESPSELSAWAQGRTGYPIVDAGMRELWQTGWMHNRVRMVVGSFLSKHLLIDWRAGENWFWDTLVDADLANNPGSWQWVAGTGVDAAPYFRIFNPVLQGEKFDTDGAYVRRYVPELAQLPASLIHKPWTADAATLSRAGVQLGRSYPKPIVDHAASRERALLAFAQIKGKNADL